VAAKGTTGAPTTVAEGLQQIASATTLAMLAPDSGPYLGPLNAVMKLVVQLAQHGNQPPAPPMPGGGGGGAQSFPGMGGPPGPPGPGAGGLPPGGPPNPDAARQMAAASMAGG
jgi:hypothetical protein